MLRMPTPEEQAAVEAGFRLKSTKATVRPYKQGGLSSAEGGLTGAASASAADQLRKEAGQHGLEHVGDAIGDLRGDLWEGQRGRGRHVSRLREGRLRGGIILIINHYGRQPVARGHRAFTQSRWPLQHGA